MNEAKCSSGNRSVRRNATPSTGLDLEKVRSYIIIQNKTTYH